MPPQVSVDRVTPSLPRPCRTRGAPVTLHSGGDFSWGRGFHEDEASAPLALGAAEEEGMRNKRECPGQSPGDSSSAGGMRERPLLLPLLDASQLLASQPCAWEDREQGPQSLPSGRGWRQAAAPPELSRAAHLLPLHDLPRWPFLRLCTEPHRGGRAPCAVSAAFNLMGGAQATSFEALFCSWLKGFLVEFTLPHFQKASPDQADTATFQKWF